MTTMTHESRLQSVESRAKAIEAEVAFLIEHWDVVSGTANLESLTKAQILSIYSDYVAPSWTKEKIIAELPRIIKQRYNYLMTLTW